jgi:hypothetical protein
MIQNRPATIPSDGNAAGVVSAELVQANRIFKQADEPDRGFQCVLWAALGRSRAERQVRSDEQSDPMTTTSRGSLTIHAS